MIMEQSKGITRDIKWQVARGIAIICVILIHCPNGIQLPHGSAEFNFWLICRQFINFPVALFFYMAGRFQNVEKYDNYWDYLRIRGGYRLLFPFIIWAAAYAIPGILKSFLSGEHIDWIKTFLQVIVGRTAPHLYYIVVLIIFTVFTPILVRNIRTNRKWIKITVFSLTPLWMCYLYLFSSRYQALPKAYNYIPLTWIGFYVLGLSVRHEIVKLKLNYGLIAEIVFQGNRRIIILLTSIMLEIVEAYTIVDAGGFESFACSQVRISSFLMAFLIICLIENWHPGPDTTGAYKFLAIVGDHSYGIYFVHYFFVLAGKKIMRSLPIVLHEMKWFADTLIILPIALFGSLLFVILTRMLLKKIHLLKLASFMGF